MQMSLNDKLYVQPHSKNTNTFFRRLAVNLHPYCGTFREQTAVYYRKNALKFYMSETET